jgi:hypothetical protein
MDSVLKDRATEMTQCERQGENISRRRLRKGSSSDSSLRDLWDMTKMTTLMSLES